MEKYYFNRMTKAQQNTYHAMKTGLESLAPSFQVPRLEASELMEVYFLLPIFATVLADAATDILSIRVHATTIMSARNKDFFFLLICLPPDLEQSYSSNYKIFIKSE